MRAHTHTQPHTFTWAPPLCNHACHTYCTHTHVHHVCIHKCHVCTYEHTPTHSLHVPTCVSVMYVQDRHTCVLVHRHIPQVSTHVLRTHAHMNVSPHTYPHPRHVCMGACATDAHARAGGTMRMRVRAFHHTCTRAHRPHAVRRPASELCLLTNGTHRDAQPHTHTQPMCRATHRCVVYIPTQARLTTRSRRARGQAHTHRPALPAGGNCSQPRSLANRSCGAPATAPD